MSKTIPIKDFRAQLATIADQVEKGSSFTVYRRSRPSFHVIRADDEADTMEWETVIDFTKKGKKKGVKLQDALKTLKCLNQKDE